MPSKERYLPNPLLPNSFNLGNLHNIYTFFFPLKYNLLVDYKGRILPNSLVIEIANLHVGRQMHYSFCPHIILVKNRRTGHHYSFNIDSIQGNNHANVLSQCQFPMAFSPRCVRVQTGRDNCPHRASAQGNSTGTHTHNTKAIVLGLLKI